MMPYSTTVFRHGEAASATYRAPDDDDYDPRLVIRLGAGNVSIWLGAARYPFEATDADHVRFARDLVEASKQYLAELERAYEHDRAMDDESQLEAA